MTGSESSARLGLWCIFLLFELKILQTTKQVFRFSVSTVSTVAQARNRAAGSWGHRQGGHRQNSGSLNFALTPRAMFSKLTIGKCGLTWKDYFAIEIDPKSQTCVPPRMFWTEGQGPNQTGPL